MPPYKGRYLSCTNCNKQIWVTPYQEKHLKTHFCNRLCYLKYRRKLQIQEYKELKVKYRIPESFKWWLAGFIDGEGTFATKLNDPNYSNGFLTFIVAQKEKTVMNKIYRYLNFGCLRKNRKLWYFQVNGYAKCKFIYDIIRDKVLTKNKQNQLKIWQRYFKTYERLNKKYGLK